MAEKAQASVVKSGTNSGSAPAKRGPGHRAVDARDAIAELTERAQEISLEAGSKVSAAMKDVISAAVGIAGFAVESARAFFRRCTSWSVRPSRYSMTKKYRSPS